MRLSKVELEEKLKSGKETILVNRGSRGKTNIIATLSSAIDPDMEAGYHARHRQAIQKPEKYIEVWNTIEKNWVLIHLKQIEMVGKLRTNGIRA